MSSEESSVFDALLAGGVTARRMLSDERARLVAVLIPLAMGAAIKANLSRTLAANLPPGDGGAESDIESMVASEPDMR